MSYWAIANAWGEAAVRALRRRMLQRGYMLVRLDAIASGGAPMLEGQDEKVILPDMMHTHLREGLAFTEAKFKSHNDVFWKGKIKSPSNDGRWRQWQQGIDWRNWEQYLRAQELFGIPGYISIVVLKPGNQADPQPHHLHQSLDNLRLHVQHGDNIKFKGGAAEFPLGIWRCSPIDFEVPDIPSLVRNLNVWEQKSKKTGIAPAWLVEYRDIAPLEPEPLPPPPVYRCEHPLCTEVGHYNFGPPRWEQQHWSCREHRGYFEGAADRQGKLL